VSNSSLSPEGKTPLDHSFWWLQKARLETKDLNGPSSECKHRVYGLFFIAVSEKLKLNF